MKSFIITLFILCSVSLTHAQERIIQGNVKTLENISVVKARVKAMSTKQEVLTDSMGMFNIGCNKTDKITISAHGFYTEKIKISESTKIVLVNLKLKPGVKNREYAIGYGHVTDKDRLTAIANLDKETTDFSRYHNMLDLIQGQLSGVQVIGGDIIVRNANSLNSGGGALIILDGRTIDVTTLQSLNPVDVKSINVIKDGSASMYGVQGGNGVVVITTRRGGE